MYGDIEHAEYWYKRSKERGTSTILKWRIKLEQLREKESHVNEEMDCYNTIVSLVDAGKMTLCIHEITSKRYDDPCIYCRYIIDKNCSVLAKPLYLYAGGRFSDKDMPVSDYNWVHVIV